MNCSLRLLEEFAFGVICVGCGVMMLPIAVLETYHNAKSCQIYEMYCQSAHAGLSYETN